MSATETQKVTLTIPGVLPSLNQLMSGKLKDRFAWKNGVKLMTHLAWGCENNPVLAGPVSAVARCYFPDRRRRDRENYGAGGLKVVIDQLVNDGCIERDDAAYFDMRVEMLYDRDNPRVELELWERTHDNPR